MICSGYLGMRGSPLFLRRTGAADVVLYGETLNEQDLARAVRYAEEAELMVVGGTSLVVYPVAGLVNYLSPHAKLVILNREETPFDGKANLVIRGDLCEALTAVSKE